MALFGWYGGLDARESRGELDSVAAIQVNYIPYNEPLFQKVTNRIARENLLVALLERPTTPPVTTIATLPDANCNSPFLLGLTICAMVLAVLLAVILISVLIYIFGRKKLTK